MEKIVLEQAKKIARKSRKAPSDQSEQYLMQAEDLLLEYLKDHSKDTEAWLLLTMIECNPPLYDYDRIAQYTHHILSYDPSNAYASLFLSYADYYLHGQIKVDTYNKLCLAKDNDPEIMAMIEVAKARYFESNDAEKCELALKKSIEYSSTQVTNFRMLGELYIKQGKLEKGKQLVEYGLSNDDKVVPANYEYDPVSIQGFFEEFFAGY
jgi:hypothetical protein